VVVAVSAEPVGPAPAPSDPADPDADAAGLARVVLEGMRALMAAAPAAGAGWWEWAQRAETIAALDRVVELVAVYRSGLLSAHKDDGRWARRGDRTFENFRGRTTGGGLGAARREMELADGLRQLPQAAQAVLDGDVGLGHAGVLARLHARGSERVRQALAGGGTQELLETGKALDAAGVSDGLCECGSSTLTEWRP
jgi:hypothetical protein